MSGPGGLGDMIKKMLGIQDMCHQCKSAEVKILGSLDPANELDEWKVINAEKNRLAAENEVLADRERYFWSKLRRKLGIQKGANLLIVDNDQVQIASCKSDHCKSGPAIIGPLGQSGPGPFDPESPNSPEDM